MSAVDAIEALLRGQPGKPPVDKWHPPLSGDIDIHIDRSGDWFHEGGRINRRPLVNLFASILRREADGEYYLVTPVEKWRIRVDDAPLIAVDMEVGAVDMEIGRESEQQKIIFRLNTDEFVALDNAHPLTGLNVSDDSEPHPCIQLDRGLSARLTRALFYRLVDVAEQRGNETGVYSYGCWFVLGKQQ